MDQKKRPVTKSDAEWRAQLSDLAYEVTRNHGTERPFTHDDFPEAPGRYSCTCCGAPLFDQVDKFDAGCGWPSFTRPLDEAPVGESRDDRFGMRRTEVHCDNCGAHLGHVFPDGPGPGGLRYCINGVAIDYTPKDEPSS
ncbi:peptide-methionine (R)-S-oxide reductase MsrB [Maritimibacter fusiformis]|uniref:peptide-methionine (R)-S-oxide reductase n=1 Tax=Maritimibacter fusiformis TaxID=2603819 RepID=A0A5D0RID0_9RHOB|nr:peptide-methionine (R)-S-oxide reductase MsrB [Maritimibacter fusiformis]TYB81357.1 peptide-methionine (R)-S-oxide reductase MsrB [Maritimibacter fusiformis]